MDSVKKNANSKQVYERPKLRVIELAAEEVMATGCKVLVPALGVGGAPCASQACVTRGGS